MAEQLYKFPDGTISGAKRFRAKDGVSHPKAIFAFWNQDKIKSVGIEFLPKEVSPTPDPSIPLKTELHDLDNYISRSLEDLIDNVDCPVLEDHLSSYNKTRLERKRKLRNDLKSLQEK